MIWRTTTAITAWVSWSNTQARRASRSGLLPNRSAGIMRLSAIPQRRVPEPDQTFEMTFAKQNAAQEGFNLWTINDVAFSEDRMQPMFRIKQGKRYRLRMRNASDDIHPIHLHRHSFELTKVAGQPTSGVMKDVVMVGGYQEVEVDFVADNPGLTLFHCHQQLHMDFGFMALFEYA